MMNVAAKRLSADPTTPVQMNDGDVQYVFMRAPTPHVVLRDASESFTEAAIQFDTAAAHEVVINAELFGGSYAPAMLSPQNPSSYPLEGQVHVNGQVVMGRSSPGTFYVGYDAERSPDPSGDWYFGLGDPPPSDVAFGGAKPMIINGLPYGDTNKYIPGAPAGLPLTGDPGTGNRRYLAQRSNSGFTALDRLGADVGLVAMGLDADLDIMVIAVQPDGAKNGKTLSALRDAFVRMGLENAVAWDGSTSATLVVDSRKVVQPARYKNNSIPVGIGFRVK